MDGSEISKSAPSLDVIAPTSQLAAARLRIKPMAQSGLASVASRQTSPSNQTTTHPTDTVVGPAHSTESGFAIDSSENIETMVEEAAQPSFRFASLIHGLPSWMVSLAVHLALILILAISSIGIGAGQRRLELEFADASEPFETMLTEIEFETVTIPNEQELLDQDQTEKLESEEVLIPLEMLEVISAETSLAKTADLGPLSGLTDKQATRSGKKGESANFFGTRSYGSRFVFVIDCSLSMKGNRWYRAVKELDSAIDGLEKGQEFLVLLYNDRTSVMMDVRPDSAALVRSTPDNKQAYRRWLRKQRTQGGTFPSTAMYIALAMDPDAIFLLSDGELQDNTRGLLQFWNAEQRRSDGTESRIPIHTISLGGPGQGQEMMRTIAKENEGEFTWIR